MSDKVNEVNNVEYTKEITLDIFKSVDGKSADDLKQYEKIVTSKPSKKEKRK